MDSINILTPGVAGAVIIGHTFVTKMMQTIMWRGPGSKAAAMGVSVEHTTHTLFYLVALLHNLEASGRMTR